MMSCSKALVVAMLVACSCVSGAVGADRAQQLNIGAPSAILTCGMLVPCYVSWDLGDDDNNDGTAKKPWKTIKKALKTVAGGSDQFRSKIIVLKGVQHEEVYVKDDYITLEGETDPTSGARLATIDGSVPLSGSWQQVMINQHSPTGVYKITHSECGNDELLIEDEPALSGVHTESRPALKWKRVIKLKPEHVAGVENPTNDNVLRKPDGEPLSENNSTTPVGWWDGIDALWGCNGGHVYFRFRHPTDPATLQLKHGSPNTNGSAVVLVGASGVTVKNFNIRGKFHGVHVGIKGGNPIEDVVIENNLITGGAHQIKVSYWAKDTVIRGNELTANLLGDKRGCTPGDDDNCWTAGAWARQLIPPITTTPPAYIRVRTHGFDVKRHLGVEQLSAIAVNSAGSGTIIEGNEIHDGIGAILIENTALTDVHRNTVRDMIHFGVLAMSGTNASIHENAFSNVNASLRFQNLNIAYETAPRKIFIYRNISYLPAHFGEHVYFHWLSGTSANLNPPPHKLHFYHNTLSGGFVALLINSDYDHNVGLGNSWFINNVFSSERYLYVFGNGSYFLNNKMMVEKFDHNWIDGLHNWTNGKLLPNPAWLDKDANLVFNQDSLWFGCSNPSTFFPEDSPLRERGVDLCKAAGSVCTNLTDFPGLEPGYFRGSAPDIGARQWHELISFATECRLIQ